jgi:hypothetical protein
MMFNRKAETVEAVQWSGQASLPDWLASRAHSRGKSPSLFVLTPDDGVHEVKPHAWAIRNGESIRVMEDQAFGELYDYA